MTRRRLAEPTTKVTLKLFSSSYARIQELYPNIGAAEAIRRIVQLHVSNVDAKLARSREDLADEIEIEGV